MRLEHFLKLQLSMEHKNKLENVKSSIEELFDKSTNENAL